MLDKIISIISRQLSIDESTINKDTYIMEDLGADSLDVVEILLAIEETTGVNVPDEAIVNIHTVGELAEYVENNME
ncbi:MAG: acyl carrier protein [Eubacteriales bacterium]|jgi:acyl carrier protein|nr:acyl carrier protein [Clostridiales bacterium]